MNTNKSKRTLLIIDDDRNFCHSVSDFLSDQLTEVLVANTGAEGLRMCSSGKVDVVLLDQKLPDAKGIDLCSKILGCGPPLKIILVTAYPDVQYAVKAIKIGAYDYLSKPFETEELKLVLDQALKVLDLEQVEQLYRYKSEIENQETVLIGAQRGLKEVQRFVDLSAANGSPVLITGETGTGKGLVARLIHYSGQAKNEAFLSHNCAAWAENLIEAELFGYEKGAFTGALSSKKGIFELAEGGTLFLDEIAELPLHLQSKLLGVLDDKKIKKLGGQSAKSVDVRIVAATNVEVDKAIKNGRFRKDLFYRLSVMRIHLPPLRERTDDIPDLCRHFIKEFKATEEIRLSDHEINRLTDYHWPGNVRELKNIIERSVMLRNDINIYPSRLLADPEIKSVSDPASSINSVSPVTLEEMEKKHIQTVLENNSGNHTRTARDLGVARSTLMRKIKRYRLQPPIPF